MGELASKDQLRMSYIRWALVTVPGIVFCGFLSSQVANSGDENAWFNALAKPWIMPPSLAFPIAWTILYVMLGLALAIILDARGAKGRGLALALFAGQMILNLIWAPIFFAAHKMALALGVIIVMLLLAAATAYCFAAIRRSAALLMIPYLLWLAFAACLNQQYITLNPDSETPSAKIEIPF